MTYSKIDCAHAYEIVGIRTICRNRDCPHLLKAVTRYECGGCLHKKEGAPVVAGQTPTHSRPRLLPDGVIAFPKRGWEPPAVPDGYQRKSEDLRSPDAWIFLPVLAACKHRVRSIEYSPCGNARVNFTCQLSGCRVITYCNTCENRDGM